MPSKKPTRATRPQLVAPAPTPPAPLPGGNAYEYASAGVLVTDDFTSNDGFMATHQIRFGVDEFGGIFCKAQRSFHNTDGKLIDHTILSFEFDHSEDEIAFFVTLLRRALETYPRLREQRDRLRAEGVVPAA